MSNGASTPPDVPDPSEKLQIKILTDQNAQNQFDRGIALQHLLDHVITYAECARIKITANADTQATDGRPPHPVKSFDVKKCIFKGIHQLREQRGEAAAQQPSEQTTKENGGRPDNVMGRHRKDWASRPASARAPRLP